MVSKSRTKIAVVGLGYVGLPLVVEFAKAGVDVTGFDVDGKKIRDFRKGKSFMREFGKKELLNRRITYTNNAKDLSKSNFIIVAVPTPVTNKKKPDMGYLKRASRIIGKNMGRGSIVVYESTVYPGVTEELCRPILENHSGMKCGAGFRIGYSPERINPGDRSHKVGKIVKVVSGMDKKTTDEMAKVYGWIAKAGVYRAKDIKTAEAAKVIENIQRDLNIALVNELSLIFDRMGINTLDVIDTANTKWNFHKYVPGLVGGHCIPVDPYYLVHKARKLGYKPKVILAGRDINDRMPEHVVKKLVEGLVEAGKQPAKSRVLIMGLTFKENVNDIRTAPAKVMISGLKRRRITVLGYDPLIEAAVIRKHFGITPVKSLKGLKVDGIILAVAHDEFKKLGIGRFKSLIRGKPVLVDVKGVFRGKEKSDFIYKQL